MSKLPQGSQSSSGTSPFSAYSSDTFMVSGGGRAGDNIDNSRDPFADQESVQDQSGARAIQDPFSDDAEHNENYDQNDAEETTRNPHKQAARTARPKNSRANDKKATGFFKSLNSVMRPHASLRTSRARATSGTSSSFSQTAYSALPSEASKGSQGSKRPNKAGWSKTLDCVPVTLTMSKHWNTKISYQDLQGSWSAKFALDGTMNLYMADLTGAVQPPKNFETDCKLTGSLHVDVADALPSFSLGWGGSATSIERLPNGMFLVEQRRAEQAYILNSDNAAVCLSRDREPIYCPHWITSPYLDYQRVVDEHETRSRETTSA